jgi:hypothetical protein
MAFESSIPQRESSMNNFARTLSIGSVALVLATGVAHADPGSLCEQPQAEPVATWRIGEIAFGGQAATYDRAYATYQRVVLGDTRVALPAIEDPVDAGGARVPGPYARYLIHNGTPEASALASAEGIGEVPDFVMHEANRPSAELSSYERYQRFVLGRTGSEITQGRLL